MSYNMSLPTPKSIMSRMRSPPPPTSRPSPEALLGSCLALQSLIETSLPPTSQPVVPPHLDSPINLTAPSDAPTVVKKKSYKVKKRTPSPRTPQRKRRRALSDEMGPSRNKENIVSSTTTSKPSTPKRQRRCPPTLPRGLKTKDFEALTPITPLSARAPFQLDPNTTFVTPSRPLPFDMPLPARLPTSKAKDDGDDITMLSNEEKWTDEDDKALVSTILNKLGLRQSDWDEASRRLGKGHDSIGERWRLLAGEGDVGQRKVLLRRSQGGLKRKGLEVMEFGPEIHKLT